VEKAMLSTVPFIKKLRSILYGTQLTLLPAPKNLIFRTIQLSTEGKSFKYFPGQDNVIADCFPRFPNMEKPSEGKSLTSKGTLIALDNSSRRRIWSNISTQVRLLSQ